MCTDVSARMVVFLFIPSFFPACLSSPPAVAHRPRPYLSAAAPLQSPPSSPQSASSASALHPDGSESVIDNDKQFDRHAENGGMFAVDKEDWMRYLENGEYLRTAEISTEQNYNMIDGRRNNIEPKKEFKSKDEKESLLGRLKEKQQLLIISAKKEDKEKKAERDLP